VQETQATGLI